jgi:hypothetical protein
VHTQQRSTRWTNPPTFGLIWPAGYDEDACIVFMLVCPDELVTAAQRLHIMKSDVAAANHAAAASTTGIVSAAQDEISQSVASQFSGYGQQLHAAVEQTGVLGTHQFAQRISAAAAAYGSTEAANNAILMQLEDLLASFAPLVTLAQTNPLEFAVLLVFGPFFLTAAIPIGLAFALALVLAGF